MGWGLGLAVPRTPCTGSGCLFFLFTAPHPATLLALGFSQSERGMEPWMDSECRVSSLHSEGLGHQEEMEVVGAKSSVFSCLHSRADQGSLGWGPRNGEGWVLPPPVLGPRAGQFLGSCTSSQCGSLRGANGQEEREVGIHPPSPTSVHDSAEEHMAH